MFNLGIFFSAANYNLRALRNWHERTGKADPGHPLLQPEGDEKFNVHMTLDQHLEWRRGRATTQAAGDRPAESDSPPAPAGADS